MLMKEPVINYTFDSDIPRGMDAYDLATDFAPETTIEAPRTSDAPAPEQS